LLEWTVVLRSAPEVTATAQSLARGGAQVLHEGTSAVVADPWGTRLRIRVA
jgi:hypothetical protein